ncbi:MAG: hypothetical protein ACT4OJ_01680, partial [Bacteroidota bacterium]
MKKIATVLFICLVVLQTKAQNVGIGTNTPAAKLQINHRNTNTSPALTLFDSSSGTGSRILFTKESVGNTFSVASTLDAIAANSSLDFRTTLFSALFVRGDRRVGINNTNPSAFLHVGGGAKIDDTLNVTGDVNIAGKLKLNGDQGTDGQVLISRGATGSPEWINFYPANERAKISVNTTTLSSPGYSDTVDLGTTVYNTSSATINITN